MGNVSKRQKEKVAVVDQLKCSYRDPSGFLYEGPHGELRRKVFPSYFNNLDLFYQSGLYEELASLGMIVPTQIVERTDEYVTLSHERISFVPHPAEWCYGMWQDTALTLLAIQKRALQRGMSLKDANYYNFSPFQGKTVLVDTLSFEEYVEGQPWRALGQFLQYFLLPILYANFIRTPVLKQATLYPDGWPLEEAGKLLPFKLRFFPSYFLGVFTPIRSILGHSAVLEKSDGQISKAPAPVAKQHLISILETYEELIRSLRPAYVGEWSNYAWGQGYSEDEFEKKRVVVSAWLSDCASRAARRIRVWDTSANDGTMLRGFLKAGQCESVIMTDIDYGATEANYVVAKKDSENSNLPIVLDLCNPTPATGFDCSERLAFTARMQAWKPDALLALAVIHHLAITYNVPFSMLAHFFAQFKASLIVEFPHQDDYWVKSLLDKKLDFRTLFMETYTQSSFEKSFRDYFDIVKTESLTPTRTLYLMTPK